MTKSNFTVPEPAPYDEKDFSTSTRRVKQARDKLLKNPKAAKAHRALGHEVAQRVERKRATLAQVRQAVGLTQAQLAATLGLAQGDVSRIEQRTNLQLATLARFIEATGGRLRITVVYGNDEIDLNIGDLTSETTA